MHEPGVGTDANRRTGNNAGGLAQRCATDKINDCGRCVFTYLLGYIPLLPRTQKHDRPMIASIQLVRASDHLFRKPILALPARTDKQCREVTANVSEVLAHRDFILGCERDLTL